MKKRYLIVIDENLAQKLIADGYKLVTTENTNKFWTFDLKDKDLKVDFANKEYKEKCILTDNLIMTF